MNASTLIPVLEEKRRTRAITELIQLKKLPLLYHLIGAKFALSAFLIPLAIRSIPEIIAGPFPIGYDTISSYVPLMLDWGSGNFSGFNPMIGGWLIFALFGLIYGATHLDPILVVKIAAPVLYGILGSAEYVFGRKVLGWDRRKSLLLVLIASVYFVSLRLSWDLFRNTLGTALLLYALTVGRNVGSRRGALMFASLVYLVTVTHLLAATLLVAFIFVEIASSGTGRLRKILCATPGIVQYGLSLWGLRMVGELAVGGEYQALEPLAALGYPAYIFLPLLPVVALGLRGVRNSSLKYWVIMCAIGVALGASPLSLKVVAPYRWAIMMSVPLTIYATNGLTRLAWTTFPRRVFPRVRLHSFGVSAYVLMLLILGGAYLALPVGEALPYYQFQSPASMLKSTVPLEDSQYLVKDLDWLSTNIKPGYVFMAHHTIYGWARIFYRAQNPVIWYYPETSLQDALQMTLSQGYSRIYTVWWNDTSVPEGFLIQHQEGPFGVFLYVA